MKLPHPTSSSRTHLAFAADVITAGDLWKDAELITAAQGAAIAEALVLLGAAVATLESRVAATEASAAATRRAWAALRVRDVVLNRRVNAVSDGLLNGPAQRSRKHDLYRVVMLGGTSGDVTGANLHEKPELSGRVLHQLAAAPDFPAKAALSAELGDAVQKSAAAEKALRQAETADGLAFAAEKMARLELRLALEQFHGKLKTAFPGQRDFVESFFPKGAKQAAKERHETRAAPRRAPTPDAPKSTPAGSPSIIAPTPLPSSPITTPIASPSSAPTVSSPPAHLSAPPASTSPPPPARSPDCRSGARGGGGCVRAGARMGGPQHLERRGSGRHTLRVLPLPPRSHRDF